VEWEADCLGAGFDCATVAVPADPADPTGATVDLFVGVHRHTSGTFNGVLFANFGGPGSASTDYLAFFTSALGKVGQTYDIVAVDPRGTGGSEPLECAGDVDAMDAVYQSMNGSSDPADIQVMMDTIDAFHTECHDAAPDLLDHMSNNVWADDLDAVRAAMGFSTISYYGASAGTNLGLAYGERHPERVDRFVLDSIASPYGGWEILHTYQTAAFPGLVEEWAADCSADPDCPIADDPIGTMSRVLDRAATNPMKVGSRKLDWTTAAYGVVSHFYDVASWNTLSHALYSADAGNGQVLLSAGDGYRGRTDAGYDPGGILFFAVECADTSWSPDAEGLSARVAESEATYGAAGGLTQLLELEGAWCNAWPKQADAVSAAPTGAGTPPYLLVQGIYDAATPLPGALAVQSALVNGSPMVQVKSASHVQFFGSACAAENVLDYFSDGTLPADGTVCEE